MGGVLLTNSVRPLGTITCKAGCQQVALGPCPQVACRKAGYASGISVRVYWSLTDAERLGFDTQSNQVPSRFQGITCTGAEQSLLDCAYGEQPVSYDHNYDLLVQCSKTGEPQAKKQLARIHALQILPVPVWQQRQTQLGAAHMHLPGIETLRGCHVECSGVQGRPCHLPPNRPAADLRLGNVTTTSDNVTVGRLEVKFGDTPLWGTVCGSGWLVAEEPMPTGMMMSQAAAMSAASPYRGTAINTAKARG